MIIPGSGDSWIHVNDAEIRDSMTPNSRINVHRKTNSNEFLEDTRVTNKSEIIFWNNKDEDGIMRGKTLQAGRSMGREGTKSRPARDPSEKAKMTASRRWNPAFLRWKEERANKRYIRIIQSRSPALPTH